MYAISENSKHYASWYHTHVLVRSSDSDALVEDLKMVVDYRYVNHCKEKVLIKKENSTSITGFKDEFAIINTTEIQGKKEQIHLQEIIGKPNFAVYANKYNDWGIHNNFWTKNIK